MGPWVYAALVLLSGGEESDKCERLQVVLAFYLGRLNYEREAERMATSSVRTVPLEMKMRSARAAKIPVVLAQPSCCG
jgi:hypothetical protein